MRSIHDNVAEAGAADRVGRQPRLHAHIEIKRVDSHAYAIRTILRFDERGTFADSPDNYRVVPQSRRRDAWREPLPGLHERLEVGREFPIDLQNCESVWRSRPNGFDPLAKLDDRRRRRGTR